MREPPNTTIYLFKSSVSHYSRNTCPKVSGLLLDPTTWSICLYGRHALSLDLTFLNYSRRSHEPQRLAWWYWETFKGSFTLVVWYRYIYYQDLFDKDIYHIGIVCWIHLNSPCSIVDLSCHTVRWRVDDPHKRRLPNVDSVKSVGLDGIPVSEGL